MTQLAMCEHTEKQIQASQTMWLVVDGNSHASELLQDALPQHGMLVSEALLPQIRLVAMMIAAMRVDFSQQVPEQISDEADWFAARMLVPPQASVSVRPNAMKGRPGIIAPTAWNEGDFTPAMSQRLGTEMPRCGSLAIIGAPDALRVPDTTTVLEPDFDRPLSMSPSACWLPVLTLVFGPAPDSSARCQICGQSGLSRSPSSAI